MANKNQISPDELYLKTREDLLPFEDARLTSLLQGVANYYTTRNDQSTWGNFLRALAQELGQLDYFYSYDIVGKDPNYLTPPDIRRRWADPLYVSSNWPSKTQFDTDFKTMLIELIAAYKEGSTVDGIQKVIFAYTGINIQVQELYKQIGNGVYDQSDRNAIKVSVAVGNNSLSEITSLTQLQQIINSLYNAIDLAKPAHVGLEFTTVFGEGDNIDCFIIPEYVTQQQYDSMSVDEQAIYVLNAYVLTNPPIFWQPSTATSNPFTINTLLKDSNGNLQISLNEGKPGTNPPTWSKTSNGLTLDGAITWKNISPAVTNLSLVSNLLTVTAANNFTLGQQIKLVNITDPNFLFINGQPLSVISSDGLTFTAAYAHADVGTAPQSTGTVSYNPASKLNILAYQDLSSTLKLLYQAQYLNYNCNPAAPPEQPWFHPGIDDTLRIFIRQIENPPFDPMLIQAPVQNVVRLPNTAPGPDQKLVPDTTSTFGTITPSNPTTTIVGWGYKMPSTLTVAQYNALPAITFNIVNTVADGVNAGYTFSTLTNGGSVVPPNIDLHDGMRVTISGCRLAFNVTGKIQNVQMISDTTGTFEIPLTQTVASQAETGSGYVSPRLRDAYVLQAGQYVLVADGSLLAVNPSSEINPPTKWIQVVASDKATNQPLNVITGEVMNWDKSHPAGLVAPRLNQVWEIQSDQDFIFGMS